MSRSWTRQRRPWRAIPNGQGTRSDRVAGRDFEQVGVCSHAVRQYGPADGAAKSFGPLIRTATTTGLTNATTCTFRVAAKNAIGLSPAPMSLPVTVGAPAAPVVTAVGSLAKHSWRGLHPSNSDSVVTS